MSVMLCAHRNAHSSVVGVFNEIIIIIIMGPLNIRAVASPRGGQEGQLASPPPTSDRTPREIDADPRRFSCRKNGGRFTVPICSHVLYAPTLRQMLHVSLRFNSTDTDGHNAIMTRFIGVGTAEA